MANVAGSRVRRILVSFHRLRAEKLRQLPRKAAVPKGLGNRKLVATSGRVNCAWAAA
jgi:hypothetical protein